MKFCGYAAFAFALRLLPPWRWTLKIVLSDMTISSVINRFCCSEGRICHHKLRAAPRSPRAPLSPPPSGRELVSSSHQNYRGTPFLTAFAGLRHSISSFLDFFSQPSQGLVVTFLETCLIFPFTVVYTTLIITIAALFARFQLAMTTSFTIRYHVGFKGNQTDPKN